jgi:hypothetical protein
MKRLTVLFVLLTAVLISIIPITFCLSTASAVYDSSLDPLAWDATISWSKSAYYPGDNGTLYLTFYNQLSNELNISSITMAWSSSWISDMSGKMIQTLNFSEHPVNILGKSHQTFGPFAFRIPFDAPSGTNNINIGILGDQYISPLIGWSGWYPFTASASTSLKIINDTEHPDISLDSFLSSLSPFLIPIAIVIGVIALIFLVIGLYSRWKGKDWHK